MPRSPHYRQPPRRSGAARRRRSITELADTFQMTSREEAVMSRQAGSSPRKGGRVRTAARLRRLEEEAAWIEKYRQLAARFDALDKVIEDWARRKMSMDARSETDRTTVERRARIPGPSTAYLFEAWTNPSFSCGGGCRNRVAHPAFLRNGCPCRRRVPSGVRPSRFGEDHGFLRQIP